MFPRFAPISQQVTAERIDDIGGHVRTGLRNLPLADLVTGGKSVAVCVGSRGISCISEVVLALLAELQASGAEPFLVPAMGSHGGGTAAGQQAVLEGYGLAQEQTGVPIRSSTDSIEIGHAPNGMPVYFDTHAAAADAIIVVNRIKPHTSFRARWESGLFKMMAVGLGKPKGAATLHAWNVADAIPNAARVVLEHMPVIAGIGIVENGRHQPARIEVLPAASIEEREPLLLEEAWRHMPTIPFDGLDLLVLQEIGKDISGTGMDLNTVGMWRRTGGAVEPDIRVLAVLDLTEQSHGNAVGIGYADLIPERARAKVDMAATYTNCLTAGNFNGAKMPITLADDRAVLSAGLPALNPERARVVILRNTLEMGKMWVSEALLAEMETAMKLTRTGAIRNLAFDGDGCLVW
jgi:hypothetical protein